MLVSLADVLAAELARVGAPHHGAHTSSYDPPPESLFLLRKAGRELDLRPPLPALLDGLTPVVVTAALERTCVVELVTGERVTARPERLSVDPDAVRWRTTGRGRSFNNAKPAPDVQISTHEAARLVGVSVQAVLYRCDRGLLRCERRPDGSRMLSRNEVLVWARQRAALDPAVWVSASEAATLAGVSYETMLKWISAGRLSYVHGDNGAHLVRRKDAARMQRGKGGPRSRPASLKTTKAPATLAATGA
jgi:hypothetical protein